MRLDVACWTSTGFKQFHKKWVCNKTDFPKPPPYSPCHYQRRWFFSQHFVRENHLKSPAIGTFCLVFSGFCFDFSYFHLVFHRSRHGNQDKTGCDISPNAEVTRGVCCSSAGGFRFFFSVKIRGKSFGPMGFRDLDRDFGWGFCCQSWWRTHQLLFFSLHWQMLGFSRLVVIKPWWGEGRWGSKCRWGWRPNHLGWEHVRIITLQLLHPQEGGTLQLHQSLGVSPELHVCWVQEVGFALLTPARFGRLLA